MKTSKYLQVTILSLLTAFIIAGTCYAADLGVWDGKLHVVYHLSDAKKVNFALGNIRNHLKGGGGPEKLAIVLVINGSALEEFERPYISDKQIEQISDLQRQGVVMVACRNTLTAKLIDEADLVGDFGIAEEGGVTRIANLQSQGYLYIRP